MSNIIYFSTDVIGVLCTFSNEDILKLRKLAIFNPGKCPQEIASLSFSLKSHKLTLFINFFVVYLFDKYLFPFLL